jgi:uncharacterized protein
MNKTLKLLLHLAVLVLIALGGSWAYRSFGPSTHIRFANGNTVFRLEVADDDPERYEGLSGRESMSYDRGMIFVFDQPGNYGIVMRDMLFDLDIIWLDEQGQVVGLKKNAKPSSYPGQEFRPNKPAKYVVELNAGVIEAENIGLSQSTTLSSISP